MPPPPHPVEAVLGKGNLAPALLGFLEADVYKTYNLRHDFIISRQRHALLPDVDL